MEMKKKPTFKFMVYGLVATLAFSASNLVAVAQTSDAQQVKSAVHVPSLESAKKGSPSKDTKKDDKKSSKEDKESKAKKEKKKSKDKKKDKSKDKPVDKKKDKPEDKPKADPKDKDKKDDKGKKNDKGKKDDKGKKNDKDKKDDNDKKPTRKLVTSDTEDVEGVVLTLSTDLDEKTPHFTASIKNDSGEEKELSFDSTELYSYKIKDEKNHVIFNSKKELFYLPVAFTKTLPVDKQYAHSLELGSAVTDELKEGVYKLIVTPESIDYSGEPLTVDFKVHKGYKKK